jgi:hypothetical protein
MDKLEEIIGRIKELKKELRAEFDKKEEEFLYTIKGKKVFFQEETKRLHKKVATRISTYLYHASFF